MRKLFLSFLIVLLLLAGCSGDSPSASDSDIIEISERFFILEVQEIQLNPEDYLGRTIRYEGVFRSVYWAATDRYFHFVLRYTDDCCGLDGGVVGFEVYFEDGHAPVEADAWVEVTGILGRYEEDGRRLLRLLVTSMTELETRGAEVVSLR